MMIPNDIDVYSRKGGEKKKIEEEKNQLHSIINYAKENNFPKFT